MFNKLKQFFLTGGNELQNTLIGKTLQGRYQIIANLEGGGIGETYLALDLHIPVHPQPKCVVKRIQPQMKQHPDMIGLFKKEAEILYKLGSEHPQIPTLYAYFTDNQDFYIVQEYIEGENLSKYIGAILYTIAPPTIPIRPAKPRRHLPSKRKWIECEVIQLLKDILEILAYVHQQGIIHQDIKPANLMRRSHDGKLILIDFGCVKEVRNQIITPSGQTTFKFMVGTPGYIPSEQALGQPRFSSDLYAVGMTAIQALTGIRPDTLPKEKNEIIWREFTNNVSDELAEFLTKMVRHNCEDRYQDAPEALRVLNQINVPKLVPILLNGNWGYISKGELVIPCDFEGAWPFSEGLAGVRKDGKWGFINTKGNLVIPYQFDSISEFSDGLAAVKEKDKKGYINHKGELAITCDFDNIMPFSEGLAGVKKDNKWGFINTNGQLVITFQFDEVWGFSEGLAGVRKGEKWGFINTIDQVVIPFQFDWVDPEFSEKLAGVRKEDKWGYINTNGQEVIPFQFDDALWFSEGLAGVKKQGKWGFVNPNGQLIISCKFDDVWNFFEGLAGVKKQGKWGFINTKGQLVFPCEFDDALWFTEGLAKVKKKEKWGYINSKGKLVFPDFFNQVNSLEQELTIVKINGKQHLVDRTNNIIY